MSTITEHEEQEIKQANTGENTLVVIADTALSFVKRFA